MKKKLIKMNLFIRESLQRPQKYQVENLLLCRGSGYLLALQQLMERLTIGNPNLLKR